MRLLAAPGEELMLLACLKIILRACRCVGSAVPSAAGAAGSAAGASAAGAATATAAAPSTGGGTVSPGASADTSLVSSSAFLGAAGRARALMQPSAMMSVSCSTYMNKQAQSAAAPQACKLDLHLRSHKTLSKYVLQPCRSQMRPSSTPGMQ